MALVLDAGALVALDRKDRWVRSLLTQAHGRGVPVRTVAGVVAQTWRNGSRQAELSRGLKGVAVSALDEVGARRVGELLALSGSSDVTDAHCALLVDPGDVVLTSDRGDIGRLLQARGVWALIERV